MPSALQAADHDAGDAELAQRLDIGEHGAELGIAVEEVAAARPHDDVERDGRQLERPRTVPRLGVMPPSTRLAQSSTRSAPAFLRGQQAVDAFDADFDQGQGGFGLGRGHGRSPVAVCRA